MCFPFPFPNAGPAFEESTTGKNAEHGDGMKKETKREIPSIRGAGEIPGQRKRDTTWRVSLFLLSFHLVIHFFSFSDKALR